MGAEESEDGIGRMGGWELRKTRMGGLGLIWKVLQTCRDGREYDPNLKFPFKG